MAWPLKYESGVTHYDKSRSFPGYNLITPMPGRAAPEPVEGIGEITLMDMKGKKVHTWKTPYPTWYSRLMPDGHIVCSLRCSKPTPKRPGYDNYFMGGASGMLMELDWDSNILFEHFDPNMHHDFRKLPNGNYMYIGWEEVPSDLKKRVRGGIKGTEHKDGTMFGDYLREIDSSGNTVWEWHGNDHLDPDIDIIGLIHFREEWTHMNDIDPLPDGRIMCSARHTDNAFIIDRSSGDVIWRWGNTAYLDRETGLVEQYDIRDPKNMGGPHDAHMIEKGLPGEGNMIVYDNGMYNYFSRALEVDIKTGDIVWQSEEAFGIEGYVRGRIHFAPMISGADRMPNGNTLICSGTNGVVFELTKNRELVWHWVREEPNADSEVKWGIFRVHRYGRDYCPQFNDLPAPEGG